MAGVDYQSLTIILKVDSIANAGRTDTAQAIWLFIVYGACRAQSRRADRPLYARDEFLVVRELFLFSCLNFRPASFSNYCPAPVLGDSTHQQTTR